MTSRSLIAVGSYTHATAIGIRLFELDADGGLSPRGTLSGIEHPSFLARHPKLDVLYAVSETDRFDRSDGGGVVAIGIDRAAGRLTPFDRVPSHGTAPCHVSVDGVGRRLYVANYGSGSVAAYALDRDGRFGPVLAAHHHAGSGTTARQEAPHAHCIVPAPDGVQVHAADLGIDEIVHYRAGAADLAGFERVGVCEMPAGSGPRHLAFHPHEPVAFVVGELDSTVTVLTVDPPHGALQRIATTSTLPAGWTGESLTAEVAVHPGGRHVYVSNRGHDSIAIFDYDATSRRLEAVGHVASYGCNPRHFAIDETGRTMIVSNQDSNNLVCFAIDEATGLLETVGLTTGVPEPVCVRFL